MQGLIICSYNNHIYDQYPLSCEVYLRMNGEIFDNPFVRTLSVSVSMAIFMIGVALGIMQIFSTGSSPMPISLILLIFAVIFIIGSVFFESRNVDQVNSMIGGMIISFVLTFSIISFFGGINFLLSGGIGTLGWDRMISALAVCMVASMVIVKMLLYRMQGQYA